MLKISKTKKLAVFENYLRSFYISRKTSGKKYDAHSIPVCRSLCIYIKFFSLHYVPNLTIIYAQISTVRIRQIRAEHYWSTIHVIHVNQNHKRNKTFMCPLKRNRIYITFRYRIRNISVCTDVSEDIPTMLRHRTNSIPHITAQKVKNYHRTGILVIGKKSHTSLWRIYLFVYGSEWVNLWLILLLALYV